MNFFPGALLILAISWLTVHQVESIPSGNEGICSLPCEVGPCKAAFERWYYDNKTKSCKEFIYGGCEGNMNNFESFDACQHTCSEGSEQVQSAGADSQAEDTAKVFKELIEKGSNPGALNEFFPEKQGQHLLSRLLSPRSHQKEVKKSQMEQTKETYREMDRVDVHPEDMRPFFTARHRAKRDDDSDGLQEFIDKDAPTGEEDSSDSSSTVATTTAAATSSSVSTTLAPSTTTSGTQTTSESTATSGSTSLAKTTSSPAVEMKANVTASPSSPTAKTSVEKETNTKSTASPALTSKTSTSSTAAKTTSINEAGAGAGAGAGVVTTTSSTTVAETQSTTKTTDRASSTKTPSTTSQSTSTTAPDQGGDTKTSSTSSSSSASSSYETTTFTETSTSVSPTTTTVASSSTAVLDESNPDVPVDTDSDTPDGSDNGPDYDNSDIHRRKYQLHEHTSSHFAAFFLSSIVLVFAVYIAYHNRQRIIAVIIEGRSENRRRPGNYRKLETNVEEAMPSMRSTNSAYVY